MMAVNVSYVSAACNYVPGAADWGNNKLICYAACNSVLIYDPNQGGGKVTYTLNKHTSRVNGVKWIWGSEYENELVSVSSDKTAVVWTKNDKEYQHVVLKGHEDVVTVVDALYKDILEGHIVIATGSSDSRINIWERKTFNGEISLKQTLNLGYNIAVSLRICLIPESSDLLIACGTNQSNIQLFIKKTNEIEAGPVLQGHEDWVRGLDFTLDGKNILLASSSQDHFIRVWKFIDKHESTVITQLELQTNKVCYNIIIDSVLAGHDGWVYSVNWCQGKLLSASLDKSMIVWEFNDDASMWLESDRVGAIGGNTLGFYGGMFSRDGQFMLAHGYHGAFHIWKFDEDLYTWEPQVTIGGHFKEVTDICWDPLGLYLMSVSGDQTTRIHAPWKKSSEDVSTWHEVARPQVHGFDISCLAIIDHYRFVSGAEEKIIRSFQAPQTFVDNFKQICKINDDDTDYNAPKGASVPSLGLSNKAIYQNDNTEQATVKNKKDMYPEESHFTAVSLTEPPTEENLLQNTLWPEVQKLYGHGYELYALAASPDGKYIASSCKSTTLEHSAIIVWNTTNWQIVQKLLSHTLTIAQLAFSPDSRHILSVSRDRRWSLFTKDESDLFTLTATTGKDKKLAVHTRIVWCCAWTHDSLYFATGSRDGKVAVWTRGDETIAASQGNPLGSCRPASVVLEMNKESITALAFAHGLLAGDYLMAVGLDSGVICLHKWNVEGFTQIANIDHGIGHCLTVKRLTFRPRTKHSTEDTVQLASCSSDHSVRIFDINL
ncbi:elongator complex protein 2 [Atheta coriaria]|uniref:elongator complex protein 2 n=1 Tax=Dalotia coriaria TaxID=877792 RepID=UPI0031F3C945